jgi:RND family efflux transporter MFP subunit
MQHRPPVETTAHGSGAVGRALRPLLCLLALVSGLAQAEPVPVRTVALAEVLSVPVHSAPASVVARNSPRLAAEIDARIIGIEVEVGDAVDAGASLVRLDCSRHSSLLAAARANRDQAAARQRLASDQLARARDLRRNKSISEELLDQRKTDLAVAEAELLAAAERVRQAEIEVANCQIVAPFDGVVTARLASVGDFAQRGTAVIALLERAGLEVSVALRHDQVATLEAADQPVFESNGQRYPLRLRTVLPQADPLARTREARLRLADDGLVAGAAGRLLWTGGPALLPADLLVRRDDTLGVFLVEADRARFVALPAAEDGRPAAVALPPASRLVTDGRQRLSDGMAVIESVPPQ